ncbi:MAG: ferredoxin [Candidatus Asgardarchaeum californiense]|nr:MAG: ferredoxin [Candidatus Asgardarchaeum californiense]
MSGEIKEYLRTGIIRVEDLGELPSEERLKKKPVCITECIQPIPCDSCYYACKFNAIKMDNINDPPKIDYEKCTGCNLCLRTCPGLAMFTVGITKDGKGYVTMPHEFEPYPKPGDIVEILGRRGQSLGKARVKFVFPPEKNDKTALVTVEVDKDLIFEARAIKVM